MNFGIHLLWAIPKSKEIPIPITLNFIVNIKISMYGSKEGKHIYLTLNFGMPFLYAISKSRETSLEETRLGRYFY